MKLIGYRLLFPILVMTVLILVNGCREAEQNRVLLYQPGVYQGPSAAETDKRNEMILRQRIYQTQDYN